jgi:glutamine cyclotransferase
MIPIVRACSPTRCAPSCLNQPRWAAAAAARHGSEALAIQLHSPRGGVHHRGHLLPAQVVAEYPRDHKAFTQGILCKQEEPALLAPKGEQKCARFWESTGLYGETSVRLVDRLTGKVIKKQSAIDRKHFGEGLVEYGDELLMLTWQTNVVRTTALKTA